jgi:hypothetical protein
MRMDKQSETKQVIELNAEKFFEILGERDGQAQRICELERDLAALRERVKPLEALLDGYETPLIVTYDQNNDFLMVRDSGAREIDVADLTEAINAFAAPAQSGEGGR